MNREIKFRIFDSRNKKMITNDVCFQIALSVDGTIKAGITGDVLMQYTGLKDKYKKEIFEGDIISIEYGKGVVEYSEKQAMFIINWIDDNEAYNESLAYNPRNYIYGKTRKDIEVIGNIYENPDITQSSE